MLTATETTGPVREQTPIVPTAIELKGSYALSVAQLEIVVGGDEQVLTVGSQSSGAGAGKVTFKEF